MKSSAYITLGVIAIIFSVDYVCYAMIHNPQITSRHPLVHRLTTYFYHRHDMPIIQFEQDKAVYDPMLTYTLKPGTFNFSSVEFNNFFYVNNLGVRDDELSLKAPKVVVVGDSFAMGIGVDQNETYPQLIEKKLGRTLNAAVSSYGTVREMRMLDRIDLSNATDIIIHYANNDYPENMAYHNSEYLKITTEGDYLNVVKRYRVLKGYFPGKYSMSIVSLFVNKVAILFGEQGNVSGVPYFLNALTATKHNLSNYRVTVVYTDGGDFINLLSQENTSLNLVGVDCDMGVDKYVLDHHLTAAGHKKIANILVGGLK